MRLNKIALYALIISLVCIFLFKSTLAKERSLFIGDLLELKISSSNITKEELEDKFKEFEIVDIKESKDDYVIVLRSFEIGEKKIDIGNNQLVIEVKSTLDELQRNDIFEGNSSLQSSNYHIWWYYIFFSLVTIVIITGIINLIRYLKKRKIEKFTPYQRFYYEINNISINDDNYFVVLTIKFKEYIEELFLVTIKGKTSSEIINEIKSFNKLEKHILEIEKWLNVCDYLKFTDTTATEIEKQKLRENLFYIVKKIEQDKEGAI